MSIYKPLWYASLFQHPAILRDILVVREGGQDLFSVVYEPVLGDPLEEAALGSLRT